MVQGTAEVKDHHNSRMDLDSIKDYIQEYGLYIQLFACMAYILKFRAADTFVYMCIGILLLSPLHILYQNQLLALAQNEEYRGLVRNLWYFGFALTDIMMVLIVIGLSKRDNLKFDTASKVMAGAFITMAVIQILGYIDQVVTETDYLADFYMTSIPLINIGVTIVIFSTALAAVLVSMFFDER
ncbi:hypothetical protein QTP81_11065 [Alteromonas sp. ASW11-36]|uniref:Uncharacterized protein n=1 Tax=Alteromonas arenosi TaxID=3055817 RepID=A0ABT7SY73_9ALTE|nr:hypothetical protein [Alteromonas sp. ASW11-36]MDM7861138.1 hypothetical protein [Alteromonas sp. ASW11-36]